LGSDGTCNFHHTGDLNNADPLLGPLQNNGAFSAKTFDGSRSALFQPIFMM
jgi:hypothetical protein